MKLLRIALALAALPLASCSFEMQQPRNSSQVGRYQLVQQQGSTPTLLLDTSTGQTWLYANDGWRACAGGPRSAE